MKNYTVYINKLSTQSGIEDYEFEAKNDSDAIIELKSNLTPQDDGKSGDYELELFEDDRFVESVKMNKWI